MRRLIRAKKGQFSVIAALLVSVILIMSVISMYSMVRYTSFQDSPNVLTAIGEMNTDLKKILDFTVGYYGSILRVTGNSTYAKQLTTSYLSSGLVNVARSHPDWNPSFELDSQSFSTRWFMPTSHSMGTLSVKYSLSALGIEGITYETDSALTVELLNTSSPELALVNVTRDNSEPELGLTKENFWFYNYSYTESAWQLVNPTDIIISSNGVYTITLPEGINPESYSVQVEDNRGLIVPAFYSQGSIEESGVPHYTYSFDWESTGMSDIYDALETDTFVVELLQNGTLRWLGQPLEMTNNERPIPPVSVKAFRVNATIDGVNHEVPFQVEDWASDYMVPLGLSGNDSIFSNTNMMVFLMNDDVNAVTLWWDGNDTAIQTPYAWENLYFTDNSDFDPDYGVLNNGLVELNVNNFWIESSLNGGSTASSVEFLRVNAEEPQYGDQLSYVIYNGVVRDIVQQEPEYDGGVSSSPNFYSQVILTFPANATYYTYSARTIFLESERDRDISDLSTIQFSSEWTSEDLDSFTENGLSGTDPIADQTSGTIESFYNSSGGYHHWSEYLTESGGAGIMFTNSSNLDLYTFDALAGDETGALKVTNEYVITWTTPNSVYDVCGEDNYHYANEAIDDTHDNSYWQHSSSENHWIVFDMGETSSVSRIRIYQDLDDWGGSSGIEIYVSDNLLSWGSPVWSGRIDRYGEGWEESGAFSAEGRYVKLVSLSTSSQQKLYEVDVETVETRGTVEFNPVELDTVYDFQSAKDVTWYGAVVAFDDEPIYPESGNVGLWVMVEHPPAVTIN